MKKHSLTGARVIETASPDPVRRSLLRYGVTALGMMAGGCLLAGCQRNAYPLRNRPTQLQPSAVEGLLLPPGFSARVIARSGQPVIAGQPFNWHGAPDGGAVFPAEAGGWIYVSNSELDDGEGGASALRFDRDARLVGSYRVLAGTSRNCAGGPTPWGTWLSCEEIDDGMVWECDPLGRFPPRSWPALGRFMHEAVAVDPRTLQLYMTEDRREGRLYRFTPSDRHNGVPDLANGTLEVAEIENLETGNVRWHVVPDPSGRYVPTREQVPRATAFAGGEGAWHADGVVYFTTKYDNRVWAYHVVTNRVTVLYDNACLPDPTLTGVDNVTVSQSGTVYVAEDGGNMQIVAIDPKQQVFPVVQLLGHDHSEITGPAFDLSGTRLYFSSQRGTQGISMDGVTYEVTGPFN